MSRYFLKFWTWHQGPMRGCREIIGGHCSETTLKKGRKGEAWGILGFIKLRFWLSQLERLQSGAGKSASFFPRKKDLLRGPLSTYTPRDPCGMAAMGHG